MAYVKHTWQDNELITAEFLNNLEDGVNEALQKSSEIEKAKNEAIAEIRENIPQSYTELTNQINAKSPSIDKIVSGSLINISDAAPEVFAKNITIAIESIQAGSGDPSPDNVRPISGFTGMNVTRTRKNLLNLSILRQGSFDGTQTPNNVSFDGYFPIKGGVTYAWSTALSSINGRYVRVYDSNKLLLDGISLYGRGTKTFSTPENACFFRAMWYTSTGITPADITADQIELGSTATDYEPYAGQTYDITFPSEAGAIYGGTLDVTTGVLTVNRATVIYDGSENWYLQSQNANDIVNYGLTQPINNYSGELSDVISNQFVKQTTVIAGTTSEGIYIATSGYLYLRVSLERAGTLEEFREWLAGNNVQICYGLAEPITYQLDPIAIKLFQGTNNVWTDTGDISVKYVRDTQSCLDEIVDSVNDVAEEIESTVSFAKTQELTTEQKSVARSNISASSANDIDELSGKVDDLSADVVDLKGAVGYDPTVIAEIEQYSINTSTGKNTTSSYTKYYRMGGFYQPKHIKATSTRGTLKTVVYYYGSADANTFISADSGVDDMDADITYPTGANYVRVAGYVIGNPDDPLDLSAVTVEMTLPASEANSRIKELEQETSALQEYVYKTDGRITQHSANLVDADFLLDFNGWTKSGEGENAVYSGLSTDIKPIVILSDIFDENTVYTASFEAYTDQESVTSGNGFRIYYDYADGTVISQYVQNTSTNWTLISLTSSSTKTISAFRIALASGASGNTWHVRKFQLTKGNRVNTYVPSISACDTVTADAVKTATVDMFRANWWNNGRIRMAMHQGMRSESQPIGNCELSFRTAGINKAWAIETDLRKTSDGKWVCFHDQSVDNLTDGTGNVSSLTYDQIRALHYVNQTTGEATDQIIPSFIEYLQICKTYNCVPLMEFKIRPTTEDCEDVIELLTNYGIFGYMFITDIVATSATIRAVTDAPLFQIASSIDAYNTVSAYIKASSLRNCGIDFDYHLGNSITAEMISDIHQNRMFCGVYTSNNVDSIKNWFSLGMDIVTSDRIADLTT